METCGRSQEPIDINDYQVTLVPEDTGYPFAINATPVDINNMVYHTYNITQNSTGIQVRFRPMDSQIFEVSGAMHRFPLPDDSEWKAIFMENKTKNLDLGHYLDPDFFVDLTIDNVTSGILYVGVRRIGKLVQFYKD